MFVPRGRWRRCRDWLFIAASLTQEELVFHDFILFGVPVWYNKIALRLHEKMSACNAAQRECPPEHGHSGRNCI